VQFNTRVRMDQVIGMLNYDIVPIEVPKSIRESKGIVENPFLKIEMTRSNAFLVRTFGEYIGIEQKGRATQLYKPELATGKKQKKNLKKSQSSNESEEAEEEEDDENFDGSYDDEEEDKPKHKK
jgi:bifunctional DNA-binding transcriptional regulator/antitoxin component of YhaV-PrlF toxin-antitoxin module